MSDYSEMLYEAGNTAYEYAMPVVQAIKDNAPDIPVRKHTAHDKSMYRPKVLPPDHWRKYDEAVMNVNKDIARRGYVGAGSYLEDACRQNMIGYLLGFIWGIQYSHDAPTECFTNIEFTLLQLDTVFAQMYYVLMPEQWGRSVVSFQNLIDLLSSLYGNCQIQ